MKSRLYKTESSNDVPNLFRNPRQITSPKREFLQKSVIKFAIVALAFVLSVHGVASSGMFVFTKK